MNRNAEMSFKQIMFMFIRMLILIIIFFSIVFVTKKYIITTNDISDTEAEIMLRSLMTNKNSVIYYDAIIDRAYPFVIDPGKFNNNLDAVFDFGEDQIVFAARISLYDRGGNPYNYEGRIVESTYVNKRHFSAWFDMARTKFIGAGGAKEKTKKYYVNVMDNSGQKEPGIVEITVVMPNT